MVIREYVRLGDSGGGWTSLSEAASGRMKMDGWGLVLK